MAKLNLILADEDQGYVESMVDFLVSNYSHKFQIASFTKKDTFLKHLIEVDQKVDILLVSPDLYPDNVSEDKITLLMILSSGRISSQTYKHKTIRKFQHGEKFVSALLDSYCEKNTDEVFEAMGSKETKVISVYSPAGGTGKTSTAVGCSVQLAQRGRTVFYLNLENSPSTQAYFHCDGDKNLSNILYYLKEKSKNFSMKIEGTRCIDARYDVHYFSPPDSVLEIQEILPEEASLLIRQLKAAGVYDYILVDLSSSLDPVNSTILEASDQIILVLSHDELSFRKITTLADQSEILIRRTNLNLFDKSVLILNKYHCDNGFESANLHVNGKTVSVFIPIDPALMATPQLRHMADANSPFGRGINDLLELLA